MTLSEAGYFVLTWLRSFEEVTDEGRAVNVVYMDFTRNLTTFLMVS